MTEILLKLLKTLFQSIWILAFSSTLFKGAFLTNLHLLVHYHKATFWPRAFWRNHLPLYSFGRNFYTIPDNHIKHLNLVLIRLYRKLKVFYPNRWPDFINVVTTPGHDHGHLWIWSKSESLVGYGQNVCH